MPDRYANGDAANDRGGLSGARGVTGYDPADIGWFHGGDYRGLTGDCTGPQRPRPDQEPGLHRGLGDPAVRPEDRAGVERRLPRLLDPRLHLRRPASRERGRLRRVRRVRAPARAEGLPRRGRQPHGRPDRADGLELLGCALPRLPRPDLLSRPLLRRLHLPLPQGREHAAGAAARGPRPDGEEARLAERRHPLPQPRRHRLRLVQRDLLRAGRLLRARRPLHRAAAGGRRAGGRLRELDRALQARRLPDRHGEARRREVLRCLGAEDPGGGAEGWSEGLRALRRGLPERCGRALAVRSGPRPAERARLSLPGCRHPLRRRRREREGAGRAVRGRRLLPGGERDRAHAADVPRQPRHRPGRRG